ncbi:MAG: formate dehydrogenase accessory protein FdhE [Coriobacteriales bacterium]|jgi:FdhE protein|nr:formate dehydrogenase accessory protein FdhE [Coriobacteriales bacterium]
MDLQQIDQAIDAYSTILAADDRQRLEFFRGLWEIQAEIAASNAAFATNVTEAVEKLPDANIIEGWYWQEKPVLHCAPLAIEEAQLAGNAAHIATYFTEAGGLNSTTVAALDACNWPELVHNGSVGLAGTDPQAYLAACLSQTTQQLSKPVQTLAWMVLGASLRPLLEGYAQAIMGLLNLKRGNQIHNKPLHCPICGSPATAAFVGPVPSGAKNGRQLFCGVCGTAWEFERIRCGRCGTQNQSKLHYFHIDGDDAHRLYLCDECGEYTRTAFTDSLRVPVSYEVEDVVMARLDMAAQSGMHQGEGA